MKILSFAAALLLPVCAFAAGESDCTLAGADALADGETLYMTTGSSSQTKVKAVYSVSIKDPAKPAVLGSLSLAENGFPQALAKDGKILYAADALKFYVISAADPAKMQLLSETVIGESTEFGPRGILSAGKKVYLACGKNGVVVMDVSDPKAPKELTRIAMPFARAVAAWEDVIVVSNDVAGLCFIKDDKPYFNYGFRWHSANGLCVSGDRLYVAAGGFLCESFTRSGKKLTPAGNFGRAPEAFFGTFAYDAVCPDGKTVYVAAGESGVYELDLTKNPGRIIRSSGTIPGLLVKKLVCSGKYLYAVGADLDSDAALSVFDLKQKELLPLGAPLRLTGK